LDFFVAVLDCADPEDGGSKLSQKPTELYKSKRRHIQKGLNFHRQRCKNYNTRTQNLLTSLNLIATWIWNWRQRNCGSIPGSLKEIFVFSEISRPAVGPRQFPVKWVWGDFPGARRPKREGDNSPLSSAEN